MSTEISPLPRYSEKELSNFKRNLFLGKKSFLSSHAHRQWEYFVINVTLDIIRRPSEWKQASILSLTHCIKYFTEMVLYVCLFVRPSVRPSDCFHENSSTIRRRMMKLGTYTLEIKSNMELEDGSGTWPLTRSNWRFS